MTSSIKITQLPVAATLTGAEQLPTVQGGITKRTNINDIVLAAKDAITAGGELRVGRLDNNSEGGRLISCRASDNNDGYFLQTFGSGSTPVFRVVKAFGTPTQVFTINDSGAVTVTGPLTLPASNPTNSNHATRKAYVDTGDRWVTLVDAAIASSTIIDVTGFSLADYYLVTVHVFEAFPTTNSSIDVHVQVYRNGSLVSTGYTSCWFALSQAGTSHGGLSNHSDCRLTFGGIQNQPLNSQITISQLFAPGWVFLDVQTVHQENLNVLQAPRVHCRLTSGSGWVDGFRIVSPVSLTANGGRVVVMGLKR
jgi:hypothetical protein